MGELANAPRGSTPDRDLAALALDMGRWTHDDAKALAESAPAVEAALNRLSVMNIPACEVEPNGQLEGKRGPRTHKLIRALAAIGAKIAPTMAEEQMQAWMAAMVRALSDLPFAFAQKGAEAAIHTPMRFLNEVEGIVRDRAEDERRRHSVATRRLQNFLREITGDGPPRIAPPEPREMTQEQINATPKPLLEAGLNAGYITQEQFDVAMAKGEQIETVLEDCTGQEN